MLYQAAESSVVVRALFIDQELKCVLDRHMNALLKRNNDLHRVDLHAVHSRDRVKPLLPLVDASILFVGHQLLKNVLAQVLVLSSVELE